MGTIVDKLSYLDTTRERILTETNRLGVGLTEQDKFRDYAKGLHNGYVDLINNGTDKLYDNMEKVSGSGSDITLENTEVAPMESEFEGDTYQKTTTGKNLFSSRMEQGTLQGVNGLPYPQSNRIRTIDYINVSENTTYTLSCVGTNIQTIVFQYDSSNNFISRLADNWNTVPYVFIPTTGVSKIKIIFSYINGADITPTDITNIQLEESSTAADFEPYTGGQPSPNPDYPQEIEVVTGRQEIDVVGKNLFDKDNPNFVHCYLYNSGKVVKSGAGSTFLYYIKVDNNETYTISKKQGDYFRVGTTETVPANNVPLIQSLVNDTGTSITVTTGNNENYLCFMLTNSDTTTEQKMLNSAMVEKNPVATEYEPYTSQSYEVNLGKNLFSKNGSITLTKVSSTERSLTITLDNPIPAGTYTISKVVEQSTLSNLSSFYIAFVNSGSTWLAYGSLANDLTLTTTADTYKITFFITNTETDGVSITFKDVQIEVGTQATSYSAYKTPIELCKIGTYKDRIFRGKGVNLFDKDNANIINGNVNNDNVASSTNAKTLWIPIKGGNTYTISKIKSARFRIATTIQTPAIDVSTAQFDGTVDSNTTYTITTNSTANYLCVYYYLNGTDTLTEQQILDSIMINEGSTALPYEPYNAKDKWYLEKQIGKVVLDGSESWKIQNTNTNTIRFRTVVSGGIVPDSGVIDFALNSQISDYFIPLDTSRNDTYCFSILNNHQIDIRYNIISIDDFKTWLSTHNVTIYYVLATPTTTEITDIELINQLEEWYNQKSNQDTTYISITSEDLPAILNINAIKQYE